MLLASSVILLLTSPLLMAHLLINWNSENTLSINISQIINKINSERKIYSFVIANAYNSSQSCLCDETIRMISANSTVQLLQANSCSNDEILLIRCLPNRFVSDSLEAMVGCLENKRNTRILFIWNTEYKTDSIQNREELQQQQQQLLFEYCAQMRLLNVIGIYRDYVDDGHFYTFSYFPQFHLERKTLDEDCFPDRIRNLKGFAIRTVVDEIEPLAIVWRDRYGRLQIDGFVVKLLREFTKRHNGTLIYSVEPEPYKYIRRNKWKALIQNDTIDIVTGLQGVNDVLEGVDLSTIVMTVDWAFMLPLPPLIPDNEILFFLLNSMLGLFLLLLLLIFSFVLTLEVLLWRRRSKADSLLFFIWILTNVVLRSIIGQPSCSAVHVNTKFTKRFIYIFLLLSGIFMSTYITAGLNSYKTSKPPAYSPVTTFEELFQSKIKIKVNQIAYDTMQLYISPQNSKALDKHLIIEPSAELLHRQRESFDTRFSYALISPLWSVYSRHQSYLPRPLFYVSDKIILSKSLPMSIPLRKHSIFMEALKKMILQMHSVGLTNLWTNQAYGDIKAARALNTTIKNKLESNPVKLEDLYWPLLMYGIGVSLSILVFCAELWYYKRAMKEAANHQESLKMRVRRVWE